MSQPDALRSGVCSRCHQPIPDFRPPEDGFTAGYYVVAPGSAFAGYANAEAGETIVCDDCMWADPVYVLDYGPRS